MSAKETYAKDTYTKEIYPALKPRAAEITIMAAVGNICTGYRIRTFESVICSVRRSDRVS